MQSTRYQRQENFAPLGEDGQRKLADSQVLICGCGALGSMVAERLSRAGVGSLRIVDRDWVELSNLQRQTLFTEQDARANAPKSIAAATHLSEINSEIKIEPVVDDLTFENIAQLAKDCHLIIDGTDNFETRFLLDEYCIDQQLPWVHGGVLGATGQVMTIIPNQTPCFHCLLPEMPPPESVDSCDTVGVLGPVVGIVACYQACEALKLLADCTSSIRNGITLIEAWRSESRFVKLARNPNCVACQRKEVQYLDGSRSQQSRILCGKNAVQIQNPNWKNISLDVIAKKLEGFGPVSHNPFFTRVENGGFRISIFKGGRTIVEGTTSVAEARSLLARTVGG